ncbi:MAG TPA: hypothetical protein VIL78_14170 [Hanamia sp.]|jgi:hypothetical protein
MTKKMTTGEPIEMPLPKKEPEKPLPFDPKEPIIPQEDPDRIPDEDPIKTPPNEIPSPFEVP